MVRVKQHGEVILLPWWAYVSELQETLPPEVLHTSHRSLRYTETEDGIIVDLDTPQVRALTTATCV